MGRFRLLLWVGLWVFGALLALHSLYAQSASDPFTAPSHVSVRMYVVDPMTGWHPDPANRQECLVDPPDLRFGCTAFVNDPERAYPFASNPITAAIEGITVTDRYLRDVVPQEMSPYLSHPLAVRAQAIAARSYIYWNIFYGSRINNTTAFQAFIPRTYDKFSTAHQAIIDAALADPLYMSYSPEREGTIPPLIARPVFAEYSADAYLRTVTHPDAATRHPYMLSVPDPISYNPVISDVVAETNAHQRGMSQHGASRWARGNSSYNTLNTLAPPWSVTWQNETQILRHYYTGIDLRRVSDNAIASPLVRWVPLDISLRSAQSSELPIGQRCGNPTLMDIWLQNTGIYSWTTDYRLGYALRNDDQSEPVALSKPEEGHPSTWIAPSESFTATFTLVEQALTDGDTLHLMVYDEQGGMTAMADTQDFRVPLKLSCEWVSVVYLPIVQLEGATY